MLDQSITYPTHSAFPTNTGKETYGLTKREYFAVAIFNGLISGTYSDYPLCSDNHKYLACKTIELADALIDALNEPKEQP